MAIAREELIAWATRNGWKLDRWGHLKKEFDNGAPIETQPHCRPA